ENAKGFRLGGAAENGVAIIELHAAGDERENIDLLAGDGFDGLIERAKVGPHEDDFVSHDAGEVEVGCGATGIVLDEGFENDRAARPDEAKREGEAARLAAALDDDVLIFAAADVIGVSMLDAPLLAESEVFREPADDADGGVELGHELRGEEGERAIAENSD